MAIRRRLEALEGRAHQRAPEGSPDTRRRMKENLDRVADLRRAGATVENNAELKAMREAMSEAVRRRRGRGEG